MARSVHQNDTRVRCFQHGIPLQGEGFHVLVADLAGHFPGEEKLLRKLKKAKSLEEYKSITKLLFSGAIQGAGQQEPSENADFQ